MLVNALLTFIVAFTFVYGARPKFDTLTPVCNKSDPMLNECIKTSANILITQLAEGVPDFGIAQFDPRHVDFVALSVAETGLSFNLTDSTHYGFSKITIVDVKVDGDNYHFDVDIPYYSAVGTCEFSGSILKLPLHGRGPCNITAYDETGVMDISLKEVSKGGQNFYEIEKNEYEIINSKGAMHISGIYGGNKHLEESINMFLNDNARSVLFTWKQDINNFWNEIFRSMMQPIFDVVPVEELLEQ